MPADIAQQTHNAFHIIEAALAEGGFALSDVVRATYYIVDAADQTVVNPILGSYFSAIRPASTMVVVAGLVAPDMRIEIEVTAFRG